MKQILGRILLEAMTIMLIKWNNRDTVWSIYKTPVEQAEYKLVENFMTSASMPAVIAAPS